jgi:predicted acyl esterase
MLKSLLLLWLSLPSALAASPQLLCDLVNRQDSWSYEEHFSESFRKEVKQDLLLGVFSRIRSQEGNCLSTTPLWTAFPMIPEHTFGLRMASGKSALFHLRFDSAGKISSLLSHGTSLGPDRMEVQEDWVTARDGARLRTLVFLPKGKDAPLPTVLTRTPYFNMSSQFSASALTIASYFVGRGYAFVFQAVRGTGGSEGEAKTFHPHEIADGADAVRWITAQQFSNGRVAAVGTSYDGLTAAAAGVENPKGLELIIAGAGPTDSGSGTFNLGGLLVLHALDYLRYFTKGIGLPFTYEALTNILREKAAQELDLRKYDQIVFGETVPEWQRYAEAYMSGDASFWSRRSFLKRQPEIRVPTYHIAGMRLDGNMPDTVKNFLEIEKSSPHRSQHRLILGYWDHGNNTPYGESNLDPFLAERFDAILAGHLKGVDSEVLRETRVQIASHRSERFLCGSSYPLPAREKALFLRPDGSLSPTASGIDGYSEYLDDPATLNDGGRTDLGLDFIYEAEEDLFLNGPVKISLYVETDQPRTVVALTLAKVDQEGNDQFLTQCVAGGTLEGVGLHRVERSDCPVFGKIAKGEKLKAHASSNLFPVIARSPRGPERGTVRIHHSELLPSRLELSLE